MQKKKAPQKRGRAIISNSRDRKNDNNLFNRMAQRHMQTPLSYADCTDNNDCEHKSKANSYCFGELFCCAVWKTTGNTVNKLNRRIDKL